MERIFNINDNKLWVLWDKYTIENIDEFISNVINLDSIDYFQKSSIFDDDEIVTEDIKDIVKLNILS